MKNKKTHKQNKIRPLRQRVRQPELLKRIQQHLSSLCILARLLYEKAALVGFFETARDGFLAGRVGAVDDSGRGCERGLDNVLGSDEPAYAPACCCECLCVKVKSRAQSLVEWIRKVKRR